MASLGGNPRWLRQISHKAFRSSYPNPLFLGKSNIFRPQSCNQLAQISRPNSTRNDPDATFFSEARKLAAGLREVGELKESPSEALTKIHWMAQSMVILMDGELAKPPDRGRLSTRRALLSVKRIIDEDSQHHKPKLTLEEHKLFMDLWWIVYRVEMGLNVSIKIGGFALVIWLAGKIFDLPLWSGFRSLGNTFVLFA